METLEKLYYKQQYQTIIDQTKDKHDLHSLRYRLYAFHSLGQYMRALETIESHLSTLKRNYLFLVKIHIDTLCMLGDFDHARQVMQTYQEDDYQSMEIEEYLRKLPAIINEHEKKAQGPRQYREDELEAMLAPSRTMQMHLQALQSIRKLNILDYVPTLIPFLVSPATDEAKTYALLLLVSIRYPEVVKIQKTNTSYEVIPATLVPPFTSPAFQGLTQTIELYDKDVTINRIMKDIYHSYIIERYPEYVEDEDSEVFLAVLNQLAHQSIGNHSVKAYEHLSEAQMEQYERLLDQIDRFLQKQM